MLFRKYNKILLVFLLTYLFHVPFIFSEDIEIRSQVSIVNPEFGYFIITSGKNAGIEVNDGLIVHRNMKKIAEAYIIKVNPSVSAAQILNIVNGEEIKEGDDTLSVKKIRVMKTYKRPDKKTLPRESKKINIITPYLGVIENIHKDPAYGLDLKDQSMLQGLYFQNIDTEKYQWNVFMYNSEDINYNTLWGGHFIFDYYFDRQEASKNVIGTGFDFMGLDMDAGNNFSPLSNFKMTNRIYAPYTRAGRYLYLENKDLKVSLMPWVGYEPEFIRGNVSFSTGPKIVDKDIESNYNFIITGINIKASFHHFFEVETKYNQRFDKDERLHTISVMANLYFSKKWGLSYRFKYMENIYGSNTYHLGGLIYVF